MDDSLQSRVEVLAREIAGQARTIEDVNGLMRLMMKSALERMLNTEMDVHLGRRPLAEPADQSAATATTPAELPDGRDGAGQEVAEPSQRPVEEDGPQRHRRADDRHAAGSRRHLRAAVDREASATRAGLRREDPRPVRQGDDDSRHPRDRAGAVRRRGLGHADLGNHRRSRRRSRRAWRTRPIEPVWPIVYFDGLVVHVRGANGRVSQHTIYVAIGVNLEGHKELLGLWLAESEGAKFWLSCLTDLKNRGLRDIFVACIDGLSGFAEAIHAAYPQTKRAVVHRASGSCRAALRERPGQQGGGRAT